MTTVRKWGVQFRHDAWMRYNDIPSDRIECARLFDSPQDATAMAGSTGTVREVLVTQEAGEWEKQGLVVANAHEAQDADGYVVAMKHGPEGAWHYRWSAGTSTHEKKDARVFSTKLEALAALVEYRERNPVGHWGSNALEVWSIRRTEPREVRRAGRTLDEILASVPTSRERIDKCLASLTKAYPYLVEHASHIDGEFDLALGDLRRLLDHLVPVEVLSDE